MGVWIETVISLRENTPLSVTPFVGVWIETYLYPFGYALRIVTPFVGVWIETILSCYNGNLFRSHPSWVCGLKHSILLGCKDRAEVTPFVGVWIETKIGKMKRLRDFSHTLRGCVD